MDKRKREARLASKRTKKRRGQMRWMVVTVVVAVGAAALLILGGQVRGPSSEHSYMEKNGNQLGSLDAPVTIIEYGDFQCGHCRDFYASTESLLIEDYVDTDEVLFEYRALGFLGIDSARAAEAAYCAADQNMFWEYHDVVFENFSASGSGGYSEERLIDFAETLNMEQDAFASCLGSGEKASVVEANHASAAADGVTGTPGFIVNGILLEGNIPYSDLQEAIATALGNN